MRRILENIFSNWANLIVTALIAFFTSPILVSSLGNEIYGLWTLLISITGYFTILDFGVNAAIVRFISMNIASKDYDQAQRVYSSSLALFFFISCFILALASVFGFFIPDIFNIGNITRSYLYIVFMVSSLDFAFGLICSAFLGSLTGLQEFKFINSTSILLNILKSIVLVILLRSGYSLLALSTLSLATNLCRSFAQYCLISNKYKFLIFNRRSITLRTFRAIYSYSIYSFLIAISLKLLFYTDSVVIAAFINVSEVPFYSIPATLLDYLEKFIWAIIAVLVPIISANDAQKNTTNNARLYIVGTRYISLISAPIVISLFFYGDDFIRLWMGSEFGHRCTSVLRYLLIGFSASFTQLTAQGILKGISKHRILSFILLVEALFNVFLSIILSKDYGIEGVAIGTMVPLLLASFAIIMYTCKILELNVFSYLLSAYAGPLLGLIPVALLIQILGDTAQAYSSVFLHSVAVTCVFWITSIPACLEQKHRAAVTNYFKRLSPYRNLIHKNSN